MEKGAWWATVHGLQSLAQFSNQTTTICVYIHTHIYMESRKMVLMNLFEGQK